MSGSLLLFWLVVMAMGVRVTCAVDRSGPGRTKAVNIFSVEIVGSFVDFDEFFYGSWKVLGCHGENLNGITINGLRRVWLSWVWSAMAER